MSRRSVRDTHLADAARPLYEATVNYNSPGMVRLTKGVSIDLIGPLQGAERGNEYIVVLQGDFTKWIGAAVPSTEAMTVTEVNVQE